MTITIRNCARCGQGHENLDFKKFTQNPIEDSDGTIWDYWTLCPIINEPILLKKQENNIQ